ncbi:MAG: ECF transporter S component, partial [Oscillospiraceae bacterium]|nr:ECF transporter S component [Candidatus Equicaccousia limihippi]
MSKTKKSAANVALAGIFSAIIILLQLACVPLTFGSVSITLTLVPIVLGGAIMGVKYAAVLGCAFGLSAFAFSAFGWLGAGGVAMFNASPWLFFVTAMVKG